MKAFFTRRLAIALLLAGVCQTAVAQYPSRYTPPAGPVLPNALNYFRRDTGVLDPYNAFVEPRRQLNQQLGTMAQVERADSARVQREIGLLRQNLAAPTGVGAGFMTHRQYFNIPVDRGEGNTTTSTVSQTSGRGFHRHE